MTEVRLTPVRRAAVACSAFGFALLSACDSAAPPNPGELPPASVRTLESGELRVRATIDRAEGSVADRFVVHLAAAAPLGQKISFSVAEAAEAAAGDPGRLELTSASTGAATPGEDGSVRRVAEYAFEPFLTGSMRTPPLEVSAEGDGSRESVTVEPFEVRVTSLLEDGAPADPAALAARAEPVRARPALLVVAAIVTAVVGAGLGALALVVWKRRSRPAPQEPSPEVRLRDAAERLASGDADDESLNELVAAWRSLISEQTGVPVGASSEELRTHLASGSIAESARSGVEILSALDSERFVPGGARQRTVVEAARRTLEALDGTFSENSGGRAAGVTS